MNSDADRIVWETTPDGKLKLAVLTGFSAQYQEAGDGLLACLRLEHLDGIAATSGQPPASLQLCMTAGQLLDLVARLVALAEAMEQSGPGKRTLN